MKNFTKKQLMLFIALILVGALGFHLLNMLNMALLPPLDEQSLEVLNQLNP